MNNNTVVLTTLLNGEQAKKELDNLKVMAKTLAMTIDDASKKGNYMLAQQLKKDLSAVNKEINSVKKQTIDVNRVLNNLSSAKPRELQQAFAALTKQLDNKSIKRNSKEWDELNSKLRMVRNEMQKIKAESSVGESFISRMANGFNKYFAGAASFIGMITGISFTLRRISEDMAKMDDRYADVSKTTGLAREEVVALNEEFKKMDTRTAREQLNELARDAGKLGKSAQDEVMQFVRAGNQINVALGEDLGEGAIRNIGKITEVFKSSTRELEGMDLEQSMLAVGSAINELGQSSTANEAYLVNFTQRLGGVAAQAGISVQNILGYASALDQSGQAVEMSATALQKFIMKLMGEPEKFARIAGIEVNKFNQLLKTDTNEAIKTVLKSLSAKGGFQQLVPVFQEMGLDGARAVGVLSSLATNIHLVDEAQRISNQSFREGTSITKEYNVKNNNLMAQLEKRRKAFKDAALELGERLNPALLISTNYVTYLIRILPAVLDILFKYGKYIIFLGTAYAAYNAGIKLSVYWEKLRNQYMILSRIIGLQKAGTDAIIANNTTRAAIAQKMYYTELEKGTIASKAYVAVTSLLSAAKYLLTGNITKAKAAMLQFNLAVKANPWGFALTIITALSMGIYTLVKRFNDANSAIKAVKEATEELNSEFAKEKNEVDQLFNALKKSNPHTETHLRLRKQIINNYGKYLQGLINEKGEIINIAEAHATVNNELRRQIALKIKSQAADKIMTDSINKQNKLMDDVMKKIGKQGIGEETQSVIRDRINTQIEGWLSKGWKIDDVLKKRITADLEKNFNVDLYKGGFSWVESKISDLLKEVDKGEKAVKDLDKRFAGMISTMVNTEDVVITGDTNDYSSPRMPAESGKQTDQLKEREAELKRIYDRQILSLKNKLLEERISEERYQREAYAAQINHLLAMRQSQVDFKADTTEIDTQLTDAMLSEANRRYKLLEDAQKQTDTALKNRPREEAIEEDYSPQNFQDENMLLDLRREYDMISEEEYQQSLYDLREEYLDKYLAKYLDVSKAIQDISADLSGAIDGFQRAEEMSVTRKYDKMIKAVGNNSKKVAQLEEEKEKAIHDVRAKYADKQFIITVANVIATTATAAMESYKAMAGIPVVGPALGAAAAAAAVLYGTGQIAIAKQQRDAAKEGYAEGGYTRKGNWWEEDGLVHKGEFVGNRFAVANPTVRKVFDVVDQAQRNNTVGSLSEKDFQTALSYNEHTQRRVMSEALAGFNPVQQPIDYSVAVIDVLHKASEINRKLNQRLDEPIVAETYIEGKGGSKQANDLYNKMKKNVSRS